MPARSLWTVLPLGSCHSTRDLNYRYLVFSLSWHQSSLFARPRHSPCIWEDRVVGRWKEYFLRRFRDEGQWQHFHTWGTCLPVSLQIGRKKKNQNGDVTYQTAVTPAKLNRLAERMFLPQSLKQIYLLKENGVSWLRRKSAGKNWAYENSAHNRHLKGIKRIRRKKVQARCETTLLRNLPSATCNTVNKWRLKKYKAFMCCDRQSGPARAFLQVQQGPGFLLILLLIFKCVASNVKVNFWFARAASWM